jgi:hypothetical protein
MNAAAGPVWIHPPRFWNAVKGKSEDEVAALLDHITQLLAQGQIEALLRFDFVTGVGYPYPNASGTQQTCEEISCLVSSDPAYLLINNVSIDLRIK